MLLLLLLLLLLMLLLLLLLPKGSNKVSMKLVETGAPRECILVGLFRDPPAFLRSPLLLLPVPLPLLLPLPLPPPLPPPSGL